MASINLLRQMLRLPAQCRIALLQQHQTRPYPRHFTHLAPQQPRFFTLPRIIQPSFWAGLIPFPLRNWSSRPRNREWNPATPYILLGLLVGSQAIQILWLKQERGHTLRRAEAKIGLLREVLERVQRGEDVNVEKELGTGNEEMEREWKEVLREIEGEEVLFQSRKVRKALREEGKSGEKAVNGKGGEKEVEVVKKDDGTVRVESVEGVKFY